MSSTELLLTCCLVFLVQTSYARKLPSYITVCKQSEPNFEKCAIESFEKSKPYLAKGIPKIKMPPLEPLVIPQLQINRDQDNIKLRATLKDIKAFGGSNFQINRFKTNFDTNSIEGKITVPLLYVEADYDVDGRVLVIPVKGRGHFIGNISDVVADFKSSGDIGTNSKGVKHLVMKTMKIKVKVGDPKISIQNTDNDSNNQLISTTALNFYNQNKRQVLEIITPIVEETAEAFALQLGNQVLKSIPLDEILPP